MCLSSALLSSFFLINKATNNGGRLISLGCLLFGARWKLKLLSRHQLEDLVADDQGVK